jgi:isopentenyldiphosphate isomerase
MIIKRKAKWVTFGNDNESETFSEHEICYITVVNKSIFVRLKNDEKDEEHMFLGSLTKTLEKLNGAIFYRIGRSMIYK